MPENSGTGKFRRAQSQLVGLPDMIDQRIHQDFGVKAAATLRDFFHSCPQASTGFARDFC